MGDDSAYSRKGFFGEVFSFLKKGVGHQLDQKLSRLIEAPLRPPGALDEVSFLAACTRCQECVVACPHHAIQRLPVEAGVSANTPYIEPNSQACHLCPDTPCISACPSGALVPTDIRSVRIGRALIKNKRCMTYRDKVCTLCYDACPLPEIAIEIDGAFHPKILDGCTGCGMCQKRCPEVPSAVEVHSPYKYDRLIAERSTYFGVIPRDPDDLDEDDDP